MYMVQHGKLLAIKAELYNLVLIVLACPIRLLGHHLQ